MTTEMPLHPLLVHIPLGLLIVLPLIAVWGLIARRRSDSPGTIWALVVVLQAALAVSAWIASEIGERSVHIAERVIDKRVIEVHSNAGEILKTVTALVFLVTLVGLARDRRGRIGRCVSTALICGALFLGYEAGQTGAELVYRHGAADAYVRPEESLRPSTRPPATEGRGEHEAPNTSGR